MRKMWMVLAAAALVACGDKGDDTGAAGDDSGDSGGLSAADQAAGEALWSDIQGYESWPQVSGWEGVVESTSVHLDQVQIWVNQTSFDHIAAGGGGDMADGAIHVKAAYNDGETTPANLTVMQKSGGSWQYARFSPDGDVELAGESALASCQGCHSGGQDEVTFTTW